MKDMGEAFEVLGLENEPPSLKQNSIPTHKNRMLRPFSNDLVLVIVVQCQLQLMFHPSLNRFLKILSLQKTFHIGILSRALRT